MHINRRNKQERSVPVTRNVFCRLAIFAVILISVCTADALSSSARGDDALTSIELGKVKVGGEIGRRIDVTINNNLLKIDTKKDFLASFRDRQARSGYIALGKLIDAAVRFAAYSQDEKMLAMKNHLIEETIKTQGPDGYIGRMKDSARMNRLWDIHEMSYIIFGLAADHHYFGEERSLEAARRLADYIIKQWATLPDNWDQQTRVATHVSVTGLERAMLALHRETGDKRYLDFCVKQRALPEWDLGIVIGRRVPIEGHMYAYFTRSVAQLELYRLQPDEKLLRPSKRAVRFLTEEDGMVITGSAGLVEIWTDDQDGRGQLGETCSTAYQIRDYDNLLRLEGDSRYGDLLERTIYNGLFGAQSPDGRKLRYFTPLEGNRIYFNKDTYCCPNNYRRIISMLPTMVYYRAGAGLAVNLYTASEADLTLGDNVPVKVRQETDFPTSGHVTLHVDPSKPAKFPVKLRIPRWCQEATVTVNGKPWKSPAVAGEFLTVEREWKAGDQITMEMPMPLRLVLGRKHQAGRAAVMRGPMVFCLNPEGIKALRNRDAADIGGLVINPDTLKLLPDKDCVRPDGVACSVKASKNRLLLKLTEFPDPNGTVVYFRLPDLSKAVPDELLSGKATKHD